METKVEEQATFVDTVKLALAVLILLAGLVSYYYFANSAVLLRAFGVILAVVAGLGVVFTSFQGQLLWKFIQGARVGQRRKSERKFFPGYVLVQMEMDEEAWHLVKEVPKVLGFIGGSSDKPAPISDKEAQAILTRVQEGADKPRPKVLFEPGEVV